MKYKPLPLLLRLDELEKTNPSAAREERALLAQQLFHQPAFQFVVAFLQAIEAGAMNDLRMGNLPERALGRMDAVTNLRKDLEALLPDPSPAVEWNDEEEIDLPVYHSGFDIPYPTSRADGEPM